ncbi:DUF167 domain-containing protein [Parerythrobacter lacustris]|uniref:UPF0235 protein NSO95_10805 n=1 Tax=Parerythrobacter lacustris TaxID=2969984 RepID=A0ABT1XU48_9SPHN|nr:DUF167 domain-containing protein [Parerythrobacter lacustris]MCR2834436.1 DUF167 domain-containing protein [Parerythrobacter lacustris]
MKRSKADLPDPGELRALIDPEGRLAIRVTPGGRVEAITLEGSKISIKVRAKPQDGAANEAVIRLVALALELAPSKVELLRGATSREKLLRILL